MQVPGPPPLAPLWDRVLRARALPPDTDVQMLYVAIRDRLTHPEGEVRLHALRVLADLLPLSGNALAFPFDQVIENLGHSSPNVRKAALDALKVFSMHCEDPECAARAIADKFSYHDVMRPKSVEADGKVNVLTGLILSIPSVMTILKRRNPNLVTFPIFEILGQKLFDPVHRDVALRSLLKLRKSCGPRDYMTNFSRLDKKTQEQFQYLYGFYDDDSVDVYYPPRSGSTLQLMNINHMFKSPEKTLVQLSTDSSSDESFAHIPPHYSNNRNSAKVIIETEIKFDSDTAITMTVLEENATDSDRNAGTASEDDYDSADRDILKYSDEEDPDVVVKKVRFGGESIKIRTPDSDNLISSEDDNNRNNNLLAIESASSSREEKPNTNLSYTDLNHNIEEVPEGRKTTKVSTSATSTITNKVTEIKQDEGSDKEISKKPQKKSGIPLPVINSKSRKPIIEAKYTKVKLKSKSLSELYDYFRSRNGNSDEKPRRDSGYALTISEVWTPEKIPSPVESHREVEVLHNLQKSPVVSPRRRRQTRLDLENDGFVLNLLASTPPPEVDLRYPRAPTPLRGRYHWEELDIVPQYVADQLHNTENWISAVRAADQLHSVLLNAEKVREVEPAAVSLVRHMWALSDAVPAARAPAEGAVCAVIRAASNDCVRQLLPSLICRMAKEPLPAALPHALLQRLALHHLVDLIFDPHMIGISGSAEKVQGGQLRAALCLARAAGPAAVLAAVRRRLAATAAADNFCIKLREQLNRPTENIRPSLLTRGSQLPVAVRRRARSTPPPVPPPAPRRLRPLPDSAPLAGTYDSNGENFLKRLSPIPLSDKDSSGQTTSEPEKKTPTNEIDELRHHSASTAPISETVSEKADEENGEPSPPRSPSLRLEEYSEKSNPSIKSAESQSEIRVESRTQSWASKDLFGSKTSLIEDDRTSSSRPASKKSTPAQSPKNLSVHSSPSNVGSTSSSPSKIGSRTSSHSKRVQTPTSITDVQEERSQSRCDRDVRNALSECILPARHEDWEVIVNALLEIERLAIDPGARAPPTSWRCVARSAATHVRSLRSRVARTACSTVGSLFEHRGRFLDPELEEIAGALLERCADVNRFLRADAASALVRLACGSNSARVAVALSRRGASHRAGPVRAAAAQALARLVQYNGVSKILNMPPEPRTVLLRAAGELLGDANAETRVHARQLCLALCEDHRFGTLLKEAMSPSRYRAIDKFVEKLYL